MSYLDRLRLCRYTSPSGKVFELQFDDLGRESGKKSAVHELPQQDAAIVQDLGAQTTKFSMRLYVSGADYDTTADAFFAALAERGPGMLAHPRWGDVSVLATSYSQAERFVDGMGEAVFEVAFVHAPGTAAVASSATTGPAVASASQAARARAAAAMATSYGSPYLRDLAECKDRVRKSMREIRRTMLRVVGSVKETAQRINAEILAIESDVDALVALPGDLAAAMESVVSAAASAPVAVVDKLAAYSELLLATIFGPPTTPAQASIAILTAQAIAGSAAESATAGEFASRAEAIAAHDALAELAAAARSAIEAAEASGGAVADPEAMEAQAAALAAARACLLETSFSLRVERRATLSGAATPLELAFRFYGDVLRLDELCAQNHFEGDRLLIVPAGTEVRYYAE